VHKANKIINAVKALLEKITGLEVIVHRKAIDEDDLPAVRLLFGKNKPLNVSGTFTDWALVLHTDIVLTAYDEDINEQTTKQALEIHKKLMATNALNLDFVIEIEPQGQGETQFNTESEITFADVPNSWTITYRANTQDPSL
jgi:hypothetical protein